MSDFDIMSGFDKDSGSLGDTAPLTTSTTTQPPSEGSNRDSLNLDDFEKVEADQLMGGPTSNFSSGISNVTESTKEAAIGLVDDVMAQVKNSEDLFSNFTSTGIPSATSDKLEDSAINVPPAAADPLFKLDSGDASSGIQSNVGDFMSSSDDKFNDSGLDIGISSDTGITQDAFTSDLLASAPAPPTNDMFDDFKSDVKSSFDDFKTDVTSSLDDFKPQVKSSDAFEDFLAKTDSKGMQDFAIPEIKEDFKHVQDPIMDTFSSFSSPPLMADPVEVPAPKRDPSPDFKNPTPPKTPTAPLDDFVSVKQPTPPRTPTPPPREPTPPFREPTPPRRVPTPPRTPTPPPREPTPPPREPTPPPREPTPPPKVPTPTPKEPTPPPRKATPPPAPRTPTPPPILVKTPPVQETVVSQGKKSYSVSSSTQNALNVFKPRAWFNPDQLDPRVVDLIYWRDVKKTGVVFGSLLTILLSLAYLSLISVVAYTSLAVLTGTITFRVYKNIMQAVQKSNDGHPFKCILDMDTNLPSEKVHEATDVFVSQINSTISELKRLFLVEDLVDSVKFGCLLWCLTYLGSWFNGLTLVILAVVALFSLPKVYEQNQAQIDQYVGLVRSQVNDVMSKVKAALPIGNKEKAQ